MLNLKPGSSFLALLLLPLFGLTQSWTFSGDGLNGGAVYSINAIDDRLIACTEYAGIFISDDGGTTWQQRNEGVFDLEVFSSMLFGDTMLIGTDAGLQWSVDRGESWEFTPAQPANASLSSVYSLAQLNGSIFAGTLDNLFVSTDTANSWTPIVLPGFENESIARINTVFNIGGLLITSTRLNENFISSDGGLTWRSFTEIPENTSIGSALEFSENYFLGTSEGIFKSTDQGVSWSQINSESIGFEIGGLSVQNNRFFAATTDGIYVSEDEGNSWTQKEPLRSNALFIFESEIFVAGQSGIVKSVDEGDTWTPTNEGLRALSVNEMVVKGDDLWAQAPSKGIFRRLGDQQWQELSENTSAYSSLNTIGDSLLVASPGAGLFFSDDLGDSWQTFPNDGLNGLGLRILGIIDGHIYATRNSELYIYDGSGSWNLIDLGEGFTAWAITAHNDELYLGNLGGGVSKSSDQGLTWTELPTEGIEGCCGTRDVASINDNLLLANSGIAELYFSEDNGISWLESVTGTRGLQNFYIDEENNLAYCSFFGFSFSPDDGKSWITIEEGLPTRAVFRAISQRGDSLYLGGEGGVWSMPISTFWPKLNAIESINLSLGDIGVIEGQHFTSLSAYLSLTINDIPLEIISSTSERITYTVPEETISGKIEVSVNGRKVTSTETLCFNINPPNIAESVNEQGFVVLTSDQENGNVWLLDGSPIEGADQQTFIPQKEGVYTVQVQSGECLSEPSGTFILACPDPYKAEISASRDDQRNITLTSDSEIGNQWFFNGDSIIGATEQSLILEEEGSYTVQYQVGICLSEPSDPYDFIILSSDLVENFRVYPNPFQEKFFLPLRGIDLQSIRLHDVSGRSIKTKQVVDGNRVLIDATSAHPGVYILSYTRKGVEEQFKLVKQ